MDGPKIVLIGKSKNFQASNLCEPKLAWIVQSKRISRYPVSFPPYLDNGQGHWTSSNPCTSTHQVSIHVIMRQTSNCCSDNSHMVCFFILEISFSHLNWLSVSIPVIKNHPQGVFFILLLENIWNDGHSVDMLVYDAHFLLALFKEGMHWTSTVVNV